MSKPIDLIIANTMHEAVETIGHVDMLAEALGHKGKIDLDADGREAIARNLLCRIAHEASLSNVFKALQLLGAPHSHDDIGEGVKAVMEAAE